MESAAVTRWDHDLASGQPTHEQEDSASTSMIPRVRSDGMARRTWIANRSGRDVLRVRTVPALRVAARTRPYHEFSAPSIGSGVPRRFSARVAILARRRVRRESGGFRLRDLATMARVATCALSRRIAAGTTALLGDTPIRFSPSTARSTPSLATSNHPPAHRGGVSMRLSTSFRALCRDRRHGLITGEPLRNEVAATRSTAASAKPPFGGLDCGAIRRSFSRISCFHEPRVTGATLRDRVFERARRTLSSRIVELPIGVQPEVAARRRSPSHLSYRSTEARSASSVSSGDESRPRSRSTRPVSRGSFFRLAVAARPVPRLRDHAGSRRGLIDHFSASSAALWPSSRIGEEAPWPARCSSARGVEQALAPRHRPELLAILPQPAVREPRSTSTSRCRSRNQPSSSTSSSAATSPTARRSAQRVRRGTRRDLDRMKYKMLRRAGLAIPMKGTEHSLHPLQCSCARRSCPLHRGHLLLARDQEARCGRSAFGVASIISLLIATVWERETRSLTRVIRRRRARRIFHPALWYVGPISAYAGIVARCCCSPCLSSDATAVFRRASRGPSPAG